MPIILLEGPDGAGKSTIAAELARRLREEGNTVSVVPHGTTDDPFALFMSTLTSFVSETNRLGEEPTFILDRFYPSEIVYGLVLRDGDRLVPGGRRMLLRALLSHRVLPVYVNPGLEVARERWASRPAEELTNDPVAYEQLHSMYEAYVRADDLEWLRIDDDPVDVQVDMILKAHQWQAPMRVGPGAGLWRKGQVVVVASPPASGRRRVTDTMFDWPGVSARHWAPWMNDLLDKAGSDELGTYWLNTRDAKGKTTAHHWLPYLTPTSVVALGKEAEEWCKDAGVLELDFPWLAAGSGSDWFHAFHSPANWLREHRGEPYEAVHSIARYAIAPGAKQAFFPF